jgi:hypothetical protein
MPDHATLVGIRDGAGFQVPHRSERFLDARFHRLEEPVRETHPADIDGKIEIVVAKKIFLKTRPER